MVRPRGMSCKLCGSRCFVEGRRRPAPGVRVRYMQCTNPKCKYRFKTEERDKGPVGRPPISIDGE